MIIIIRGNIFVGKLVCLYQFDFGPILGSIIQFFESPPFLQEHPLSGL